MSRRAGARAVRAARVVWCVRGRDRWEAGRPRGPPLRRDGIARKSAGAAGRIARRMARGAGGASCEGHPGKPGVRVSFLSAERHRHARPLALRSSDRHPVLLPEGPWGSWAAARAAPTGGVEWIVDMGAVWG